MKNKVTETKELIAFEELRQQAKDTPELSLDEINVIIAETRQEQEN